MNVEFSVEVKAKAERLYDILTDLNSWPEWQGTSYIRPLGAGPLKKDSTFKAELGGLKWNITVVKAERPNKISWTGHWLGLKAIHEWEFIEEGEKTLAITRESMYGWMLYPIYPIVKIRLPRTDEKWLNDLKSRAEHLRIPVLI